jgi:hypothetical protein
MGSYCSSASACCHADKNEESLLVPAASTVKSANSVTIQDVKVRDEQEVSKLESLVHARVAPDLITSEICSHANVITIFELMRKNQKTAEDYEILLMRDSQL